MSLKHMEETQDQELNKNSEFSLKRNFTKTQK